MYHKNQKIVPIDFEGQDEESIEIDPNWERFSSEETVQEIKNILYGLKTEDRRQGGVDLQSCLSMEL